MYVCRIAADSGYPISVVVMKPFHPNEAREDRRKAIYNRRLSAAR